MLFIIPSSFVHFSFLYFYTDDNGDDKNKMNTIEIDGKKADCFKCGSPFNNVPRVHISDSVSNTFNNKTAIDAGEAA